MQMERGRLGSNRANLTIIIIDAMFADRVCLWVGADGIDG